ncbi:hypothetical protein MP638_007393 [Amoeboaphelidium occidentale]|nr:hypothetical protein MP638_007393 [Amoeboaphelidium occidentale]
MALYELKYYFVTFFLGLGCLFPFMTMYYRALGLTAAQIGFLGSVMPIFNFVLTPVWSFYADKYKSHKRLLGVATIISAVACLVFPILGNTKNDETTFLSALFFETLAILVLFAIFYAPTSTLLDTIVLHTLKTQKSKDLDDQTLYGRQRVFGSIAYGVGGFIVSFILDSIEENSSSATPSSMNIIFYGYALLNVVFCIGLVLFRQKTAQKSEDRLRQRLLDEEISIQRTSNTVQNDTNAEDHKPTFMQNVQELIVFSSKVGYIPYFWAFCFIMGSVLNMINSYCFLMLADKLNAPNQVFGLISISRILLEIPFFIWSGPISKLILSVFMPKPTSAVETNNAEAHKMLGYRYMMLFSMGVLSLRLLLYACMSAFQWSAWTGVGVEILHGVIYATFFSAAIQIASLSAPTHLQATSQGLFGGIYSGFGSTFGNLVGGVIYGSFGPTALWLSSLVLCIITMILYRSDIMRTTPVSNNIVAR